MFCARIMMENYIETVPSTRPIEVTSCQTSCSVLS